MTINIYRTTSLIMIVTLCSKFMGMFREIFLARQFGASIDTDAYLVATMIPLLIFMSLGGAIKTTFLPLFTEYHRNDPKEGFYFAGIIFNLIIIIGVILTVFGITYSHFIVKLVAPGFKGAVLEQTIELNKWLFVSIIFVGLLEWGSGVLNSLENFVIPACVSIPYNVIIILSIVFLSANYGIKAVTIGTLLAFIAQFLLVFWFVLKAGFRIHFKIDLSHPGVIRVFKLALPVLIGVGITQLSIVVDRIFASNLPAGSISAMNYAVRINGLVSSIFISALVTALYPAFAHLTAANDLSNLKLEISKALRLIGLVILPIMCGLFLTSKSIIAVVFERGAFLPSDTLRTASALQYFSLGLIFIAYREIIYRVFYALKNTKTPVKISIVAIVSNIILNFLLVAPMGLNGLALSTSVSAAIGSVLLFVSLGKKIGRLDVRDLASCYVKALIATALMTTTVLISNLVLVDLNVYIKLFITIVFAAVTYILALIVFKTKETELLLRLIRKFFNRGQEH